MASHQRRRRNNNNNNSDPTTTTTSSSPIIAPQIKGVPSSITPLLIALIKQQSRLLKTKSSDSGKNNETDDTTTTTTTILHPRQKRSNTHTQTTNDHHQLQHSKRLFYTSLSKEDPTIVPPACLTFCISLLTDSSPSSDNKRKALRRRRLSACHVIEDLLRGSRCCRELFSETLLWDTVTSLGDDDDEDREILTSVARLLVKVTDEWGYGDVYPRLEVARRFLEEKRGVVVVDSSNGDEDEDGTIRGGLSLSLLRKKRDEALTYGEREMRRVLRIVQRMDECFELLIPRFGFGVVINDDDDGKGDDGDVEQQPKRDGEEEKEEEDIAWEDGDCDDLPLVPPDYDNHYDNVERTLAARSAGDVADLSINIDFENDDNDDIYFTTTTTTTPAEVRNNNPSTAKVQEDLQKCINLLKTRHVPRLRLWIESLLSADDVVVVVKNDDNDDDDRVGLLPLAMKKKRRDMMSKLITVKTSALKALSSGRRIGMEGQIDLSSKLQRGNNGVMSASRYSLRRGLNDNNKKEDEETMDVRCRIMAKSLKRKPPIYSGSVRKTSRLRIKI